MFTPLWLGPDYEVGNLSQQEGCGHGAAAFLLSRMRSACKVLFSLRIWHCVVADFQSCKRLNLHSLFLLLAAAGGVLAAEHPDAGQCDDPVS